MCCLHKGQEAAEETGRPRTSITRMWSVQLEGGRLSNKCFSPLHAGIQNGFLEKKSALVLQKCCFWYIFFSKIYCWRQTGWSREQVPRMWDLLLAPACLQFCKSTARSVSRIKWFRDAPLSGSLFLSKCWLSLLYKLCPKSCSRCQVQIRHKQKKSHPCHGNEMTKAAEDPWLYYS